MIQPPFRTSESGWVDECFRESGIPPPVRRLAPLFPPARRDHAAVGFFFGAALPLDRQYVELLAARFRHLAPRYRVPLLGRPRLFVEASMGASDRPCRRAAIRPARPAARLDVRRPGGRLSRPVG